MSTVAGDNMKDIANKWEDQYSSAVLSGIVGDTNHPDGYHISYDDNPHGNWSCSRPDDKPPNMPSGNSNDACAIDMSMNTSDMKKCYSRALAVYNDKNDPRRKYLNAFNGWDGSGDATRLDFYANTKSYASPDHTWHCHCEMKRKYANDAKAGRAWLSMTGGQSKQDWIDQEEFVALTDDDIDKVARRVISFDQASADINGTNWAVRNRDWRHDFTTNSFVQTRFAWEDTWDHVHRLEVATEEIKAAVAELEVGGVDEDALAQKVAAIVVQHLGGLIYKPEPLPPVA